MTVARLFLAVDGRLPAPPDAIACTTLDELDRVHRSLAPRDVAIPLGLTPAMQWSMLTVVIGGHRIASDAIHAIALIRATGPVRLAGRTLDRTALLTTHRSLRALEVHLLATIVDAIGPDAANRWATDCNAAIDGWQQRRSHIRAAAGRTIMAHPEGIELDVRSRSPSFEFPS